MEIDFLGLNSTKYDKLEQERSNYAFIDTAKVEVETSLSLSTSSSLYYQREILNFSEKKKKKFPCDKIDRSCSNSSSSTVTEQHNLFLVPPPIFRRSAAAAGFLYDLNDKPNDLRSMSEIPDQPASLTMLYSVGANFVNDTLPQKSDNSMYITGNARLSDHARIRTKNGHTPTVAMARRATLARFLEKRLHR
ncbi:hypothetical protein DH2020_038802 [Rehmannia glutinosa]|uniref:Uncharacterized protein n=1 Tax=Rehmannia glutinosa TaxID=99300 RepID=A0ABR0UY64_REHGL